MINFLRRIVNKLRAQKPVDKFCGLLDSGNLVVGKNSDIQGLTIHAYSTKGGFVNIEIGDDCLLQGSITLYTDSSKVIIGDRVFIGPNTSICCYGEVEVKSDVMFSWGITVIDTNAHSLLSQERMSDVMDWKRGWQYKNWSVVEHKKILIGEKCWIGFNSIILKGVTLGEGTVVGAGSVVTKGTQPFSIIGGNPAVLIKQTS